MDVETHGQVREATLEAVIIRKDGTREDLGEIARYDRPKPTLVERIVKWLSS